MPTDDDLVAEVLREVGDPNGTIGPLAATIFGLYADRRDRHPELGPRLQALYTKRALLDVRLAEEQPTTDVTVQGEFRDRQGERFAHLVTMRASCQDEIARLEAILGATRGPRLAALLTTEPIPPPWPGTPSAGDQIYRGSPYVRRGQGAGGRGQD